MSTPTIYVRGAWSELTGVSTKCLQELLAPMHPKCRYNPAYRDGRWDGRVRLYEGRNFPSGNLESIVEWFNRRGQDVIVHAPTERVSLNIDGFTDRCLPGITLREHQYAACCAMLTNRCGSVQSPTGSGKTEIMIAVAKYVWEERQWRTLIVVPRRGLARQTVERFRRYVDFPVGQCGDGKKETDGVVTVGTAQTLIGFKSRRMKKQGRYRQVPADLELVRVVVQSRVLMLDEAHHASADTWYEIAMASNARRRYGLSGTLLKNDALADLKMVGATGEVVYTVPARELIDAGLSARPKIVMVMHANASEPDMPKAYYDTKLDDGRIIQTFRQPDYAEAYRVGIVESMRHNEAVVRAALWLADRRRRTLVMCRRKAHFRLLERMFDRSGVAYLSAWGATETDVRDEIKKKLQQRKIEIILATTIFDEGEDIPSVEAIVLAEGVKATTNALQRIGRGMRLSGDDEVWVVDFVPLCHRTLTNHAGDRFDAYTGVGYDAIVHEEWPDPDDRNYDDADLLPFDRWEEVCP